MDAYSITAILSAAAGLALLAALSIIDMRSFLLPDKLTAPFAALGVFFHFLLGWELLAPMDVAYGGALGFGFLYVFRAAANKIYGRDVFGLGDVKLMGGGGLWLGIDGILIAITLGAGLGALQGIIMNCWKQRKSGKKEKLTRLVIPAGPGFAMGIALTGLFQFL